MGSGVLFLSWKIMASLTVISVLYFFVLKTILLCYCCCAVPSGLLWIVKKQRSSTRAQTPISKTIVPPSKRSIVFKYSFGQPADVQYLLQDWSSTPWLFCHAKPINLQLGPVNAHPLLDFVSISGNLEWKKIHIKKNIYWVHCIAFETTWADIGTGSPSAGAHRL